MDSAKIDNGQAEKRCFIATPIGEKGSSIRDNMVQIVEICFKPLLKELGYTCISPIEIAEPGNITSQVIELLFKAELVIANLTEPANPNVMYELAIRHAVGKPVIIVKPHLTALPFDISGDRVVTYVNDAEGFIQLRGELRRMLELPVGNSNIDNPVYRAIQWNLTLSTGNDIDNDFKRLVHDDLISIRSDLNNLTRLINSSQPLQSIQSVEFKSANVSDRSNWPKYTVVSLRVDPEKPDHLGIGPVYQKLVGELGVDFRMQQFGNNEHVVIMPAGMGLPIINKLSSLISDCGWIPKLMFAQFS